MYCMCVCVSARGPGCVAATFAQTLHQMNRRPFPHYDSRLTSGLSAGIRVSAAISAVLLNVLSSMMQALNHDIDSSL